MYFQKISGKIMISYFIQGANQSQVFVQKAKEKIQNCRIKPLKRAQSPHRTREHRQTSYHTPNHSPNQTPTKSMYYTPKQSPSEASLTDSPSKSSMSGKLSDIFQNTIL